jgi:bifunctional non-homologous end joining protein LigD/DNA ligase-1
MNLWNSNYFEPMLLSEVSKPFDSEDYIYELKYDGMRCLIFVSSSYFRIMNRHFKDITYLFPELRDIQKNISHKVIFDGEIICVVGGKPSFSKLQERIHLKNKSKINYQSLTNPVVFMAFDIIYDDKNLVDKPLLERKKILEGYEDNNLFVKSFFLEKEGIKLFKNVKKLKLEGIVAKKKDSKYYINTRSDEWVKIKNFREEDFLIGGYLEGKSQYVISLLLGEYRKGKFYYVGNVVLSKKNKLYDEVIKCKRWKNPFVNYDKGGIYIKPILKIKVSYIERTGGNNLRQPFVSKEEKTNYF